MKFTSDKELALENLVLDRLKEQYKEDLQDEDTSEALIMACEEHYGIINAILLDEDENVLMGLVEALKRDTFETYKESEEQEVYEKMSDFLQFGDD